MISINDVQDGNEEEDNDHTIKDQYLAFSVDGEEYATEIENIKEIISICSITKVPETPVYVKGIVNLRGDIIPVIDVRARFLKPAKEYDELTCIIVYEFNEYSLGLIVDEVREVLFIQEDDVTSPPNAKLNFRNQFIKSIGTVGDKVKLILDLEKVM
jgi:purine-binding chemotaxis protein CheW